ASKVITRTRDRASGMTTFRDMWRLSSIITTAYLFPMSLQARCSGTVDPLPDFGEHFRNLDRAGRPGGGNATGQRGQSTESDPPPESICEDVENGEKRDRELDPTQIHMDKAISQRRAQEAAARSDQYRFAQHHRQDASRPITEYFEHGHFRTPFAHTDT